MDPAADSMPLIVDPLWPWPAIAGVALLLLAAAVWSYLRTSGATLKRVAVVLGLRLLALFLILLALAGASCVSSRELKVPSLLIIGLDASESMARFKDEVADRSRWEEMWLQLRDCQPTLEKLRKEHNISVMFFTYGDDVNELTEFDPARPGLAEGKRTDHAQLLRTLHERFRGEKHLRGLLIHSDGADNSAGDFDPNDPGKANIRTLAERWRLLPCPVHAFGYGREETTVAQNDIVITSLTPEPSVVSVKGKLSVRATIDALGGLVGSKVRVKVYFDDTEIAAQDEVLRLRKDNQVQMTVDAPATPGEIKLTLKVHDPDRPGQPLQGELRKDNNEISTFVTVSQEGLSVLLIERQDRFPEPQMLLSALAADKRIRVYRAWLRGDRITTEDGKGLLDFKQQPYDVIILGDVTADRLRQADPEALEKIAQRVEKERTGLLMMAGRYAFGNGDWAGTPIEGLLPTRLDAQGQSNARVKIKATPQGLDYVMRLGDAPGESQGKWDRLELFGYTPLGTVKDGSIRMAESAGGEQPLLVGRNVGTGRTMVFAGDTTHRWVRPKVDGAEIHSRFWRQVVLWLAHQDKTEDRLRIRLDTRRLRTGDNLGFGVELQGKQGEPVKDARMTVKVIDPRGQESLVQLTPGVKGSLTENEQRGNFKPRVAGEYRIEASGTGTTAAGEPASGQGTARFLAYQDDAETSDPAANPNFLKQLVKDGGGQFHRPRDLKKFLEQLPSQPLPSPPPKPTPFPNWRQTKGTSPFLLAFLLLFIQVLALEWFLRRRWGMV